MKGNVIALVLSAAGLCLAESPYGYAVVDAYTEEKSIFYNNPANVLGEPKRAILSSTPQYGDTGSVIHPAYSAFGRDCLFSLVGCDIGFADGEGEGYYDEEGDWIEPDEVEVPAHVTIAFDHDVVDDPMNPWGIDLIVFGNSFATKSGGDYVTLTSDPNTVTFTGHGSFEDAVVSVSPDGEHWYSFEDGPYADDLFPTLGYRYEPEDPDKTLFSGNLYWGRPTDATRPVNPSVRWSDFKGKTLAEICRYYNGSAGGTGYDLALARDADGERIPLDANGRRSIRYVKIENMQSVTSDGDFGWTAPEIDAVADVSPLSEGEKWVERHVTDWTLAWSFSFDWAISGFEPGADEHLLTLRTKGLPMADAMGIRVEGCDVLGAGWTSSVVPELVGSKEESAGVWRNVFRVPSSCGRFLRLKEADE